MSKDRKRRTQGYSKKYDAYFDLKTREWEETDLCGDPDCEFCKDRPPTAHGLPDDYPTLASND